MLELHGAGTGNSYRAAIALHEAGLAFEARQVDLRAGEQRSPGFLALNPAGKTPVLVDRRDPAAPLVLTQSNAIIFYAAERGAPHRLLPQAPLARVRAIERFFYFVTDAIVWSGAAFTLSRGGEGQAAALLEATLVKRIEDAEAFLADGPYMAGESFTLADVAGFTITRAYRGALDWRSDRPLAQWFERVGARPGVQQGLAAFG